MSHSSGAVRAAVKPSDESLRTDETAAQKHLGSNPQGASLFQSVTPSHIDYALRRFAAQAGHERGFKPLIASLIILVKWRGCVRDGSVSACSRYDTAAKQLCAQDN